MWTKQNRGLYERKTCRYLSDLLDGEWVLNPTLAEREEVCGACVQAPKTVGLGDDPQLGSAVLARHLDLAEIHRDRCTAVGAAEVTGFHGRRLTIPEHGPLDTSPSETAGVR